MGPIFSGVVAAGEIHIVSLDAMRISDEVEPVQVVVVHQGEAATSWMVDALEIVVGVVGVLGDFSGRSGARGDPAFAVVSGGGEIAPSVAFTCGPAFFVVEIVGDAALGIHFIVVASGVVETVSLGGVAVEELALYPAQRVIDVLDDGFSVMVAQADDLMLGGGGGTGQRCIFPA